MKSPAHFSYSVNPSTTPSIRPTMASRVSTDVRGQEGFEFKGILLLAICGLYALLLFVLARILSYTVSKITAPVKSIFFSVSTTEVRPQRKLSMEINNNDTKLPRVPRVHTRSLCHG